MTINTDAIDYANAKVKEVKKNYLTSPADEQAIHQLALDAFNSRSESQTEAERAARELIEYIGKLRKK